MQAVLCVGKELIMALWYLEKLLFLFFQNTFILLVQLAANFHPLLLKSRLDLRINLYLFTDLFL